ncbi:hypothetical protein RSAG8_03271, partial [Rhizoctonia solani AG-8 WAC10335]
MTGEARLNGDHTGRGGKVLIQYFKLNKICNWYGLDCHVGVFYCNVSVSCRFVSYSYLAEVMNSII